MSELIDVPRLTAWLDSVHLGAGEELAVEPLAGGASNAMFVLTRGGQSWVLRRPTRVSHERANDGMRREFAILRALAGTDVPHPEVMALCDDPAVLGATFYVMAWIDGIPPLPPLPAALAGHQRDVSFALVDALVALHRVDWRAGGLAELDRSAGFHDRQVTRWTTQLASYHGRELPGIDRVAAWLDVHRPAGFEPTIMHGDYHMLNVLVGRELPARVVAVLDWETATIGDPLLDLAGFLEVWCGVTADAPWPTRAELVERYAAGRGLTTIGDLTYYEVLYNFRLAVLLEGAYQRSTADGSPGMVAMGERVLFCVERAGRLVDGG